MKISDFDQYEIPTESKEHHASLFRTGKKISLFKRINQSFIDFTICNLLRIIVGFGIFQFLSRNLPSDIGKQLQGAKSNQEFLFIITTHHIHNYIFFAVLLSFIMGSLYYIIMMKKSSFGTIGMKFTKLVIQTKHGGKPTFLQTTLWYYIKIIYPICVIIAIIIFLTAGANFAFVVFALIAVIFSDSFTIVFGIQPLYEKFSSIKLTEKQ